MNFNTKSIFKGEKIKWLGCMYLKIIGTVAGR
jgi:hypothetical protein